MSVSEMAGASSRMLLERIRELEQSYAQLSEALERLEATTTRELVQLVERTVQLETKVSLLTQLQTQEPSEPEECHKKECSYYEYLAYGPAELVHEGFHQAERMARKHFDGCSKDWKKGPCSICTGWEQRLRA